MREQISLSILTNTSAQISLVESNLPEKSNVARIDKITTTTMNSGYVGFQLSETASKVVTPLNGAYNLYSEVDGYPGFISKQLTTADGTVSSGMLLQYQFAGGLSDYLTIIFDEVANEYATNFSVVVYTGEGNNYTFEITDNTSAIVLIPLHTLQLPEVTSGIINLHIYKWSQPYKSVKVVQFISELLLHFTGSDIYNFTCSENSMDAQLSLSPGIIEQYADIEIYDRQGVLRQIIAESKLDDIAKCKVTINAIDQDVQYFLGSYRVKNWEVQATNLRVNITCDDVFSSFSNIEVPTLPIQTRKLDEWITYMFDCANISSWKYANYDTWVDCVNIQLTNSWSKPSDLYTLVNKLCSIGFLRIYYFEGQFVVMRLVHLLGR